MLYCPSLLGLPAARALEVPKDWSMGVFGDSTAFLLFGIGFLGQHWTPKVLYSPNHPSRSRFSHGPPGFGLVRVALPVALLLVGTSY